MTTEELLHRVLDEEPANTLARLQLADWYEEQGEGEKAAYYRFTAKFGIAPVYQSYYSPAKNWQWYSSGSTTANIGPPAADIWGDVNRSEYSTRRLADEGLMGYLSERDSRYHELRRHKEKEGLLV